jgi:hypothetical protein
LETEADRESYGFAVTFLGFQMSIRITKEITLSLMFRVSAMRELRAFAFRVGAATIQPDMKGKREAQ